MSQLNIFADCTEPKEQPSVDTAQWRLFVDGASRNNPGRAGAGIFLVKNDKPVHKGGYFLGIKTNNQAEYLALLIGICIAKQYMESHDLLSIVSDSELLIKQLKGEYKVKNPALKTLHAGALSLLAPVNYNVCHVLREYNKDADAMANKGVDTGAPVPDECATLLHTHGISI